MPQDWRKQEFSIMLCEKLSNEKILLNTTLSDFLTTLLLGDAPVLPWVFP
jgi:hypothetical protein